MYTIEELCKTNIYLISIWYVLSWKEMSYIDYLCYLYSIFSEWQRGEANKDLLRATEFVEKHKLLCLNVENLQEYSMK